MSSFSALTRIVFQKRSIARSVCAWRFSQARKGSEDSFGIMGAKAAMAPPIASLSCRFRQGAFRNEVAVCKGAGSDDEEITDARPPGSRKVSASYQRILSC